VAAGGVAQTIIVGTVIYTLLHSSMYCWYIVPYIVGTQFYILFYALFGLGFEAITISVQYPPRRESVLGSMHCSSINYMSPK
jgi:hypothetical protein